MSGLPPGMQLEALAEHAWLLRLGERIDATLNARVHAVAARVRAGLPGVECVPAYASLLLRLESLPWPEHDATERLRDALAPLLHGLDQTDVAPRTQELPVWYGGEAGADLPEVARHAGMSVDEVIARHTGARYRVAMLGFAPGFPYLLGLDPALAMPRRSQPRTRVPAGSVAIGGEQTGIYPQALPGGWHLLGRTPVRLFDLTATSPSLLQPGDAVHLRAIDEDEYRQLAARLGDDA